MLQRHEDRRPVPLLRPGRTYTGRRLAARTRRGFEAFARDFGLAFQIADDLIDATGDADEAGKAVGKDADAGKATYVSHLGVEGARGRRWRGWRRRRPMRSTAYGAGALGLQALAFHMIGRRS